MRSNIGLGQPNLVPNYKAGCGADGLPPRCSDELPLHAEQLAASISYAGKRHE